MSYVKTTPMALRPTNQHPRSHFFHNVSHWRRPVYYMQRPVEMWWHTRRNQISSFGETDEVHLNRRGRQFSRLLAAEVCASAVVMQDTPCSEVVWRVLATHSIRQFPLHFRSRASPCAITFQLESTYKWHLPLSISTGSTLNFLFGIRIFGSVHTTAGFLDNFCNTFTLHARSWTYTTPSTGDTLQTTTIVLMRIGPCIILILE